MKLFRKRRRILALIPGRDAALRRPVGAAPNVLGGRGRPHQILAARGIPTSNVGTGRGPAKIKNSDKCVLRTD